MGSDLAAVLRRAMRKPDDAPAPATCDRGVAATSPLRHERPGATPITPATPKNHQVGKSFGEGCGSVRIGASASAPAMPYPDLSADASGCLREISRKSPLESYHRAAKLALDMQMPDGVTAERWRRALDDGGRFLDAWGNLAALWGWTVAELFDVPRDGQRGGLIWLIGGATVEAFGPDHARLNDGQIFDRGTIGGMRDG